MIQRIVFLARPTKLLGSRIRSQNESQTRGAKFMWKSHVCYGFYNNFVLFIDTPVFFKNAIF
jgi:hypothetical protein